MLAVLYTDLRVYCFCYDCQLNLSCDLLHLEALKFMDFRFN